MKDLQSEARAPLIQAPIAWVARRLLATDASVEAVMIVGREGKVLAHERAIGYDEDDSTEGEGHPLLFYAQDIGLLFYVKLGKHPRDEEIPNRIMAIIRSPSFCITR